MAAQKTELLGYVKKGCSDEEWAALLVRTKIKKLSKGFRDIMDLSVRKGCYFYQDPKNRVHEGPWLVLHPKDGTIHDSVPYRTMQAAFRKKAVEMAQFKYPGWEGVDLYTDSCCMVPVLVSCRIRISIRK